ncbi:MAG TPA: hypothetical protein VMB47_18195 [Candidatus Aquilonibacter sp.]|nr:hypothetical protein [Candidatus Aquilonibacter sp.]
MSRELLREEGGVFEIGALVDLGDTRNIGHAPEVEDREFSVENLRYRRRLKPDAFWKSLTQTSHNELHSIFGDELEQRESSCTVNVDCGVASLGHLAPERIPYFAVNPWGKIRMQISAGQFRPDLSVTDIRLYKSDQQTARRRIQASVAGRLAETRVLLAVGLTRPWKKNSDTVQRHWLQVNNIHLEEDPLGEMFEF